MNLQCGLLLRVGQMEAEHRQPGEDTYAGTRAQLPGDTPEQIRAHREMAVGEIQRICSAIPIRVGKGLQEHMAGADVLDALYQHIEVALQLCRVRVVDIIQIDLDRTHAVTRQITPQFASEIAYVGIVEQQQAAQAGQRLTIYTVATLLADIGLVRAAFQVEAKRHAQARGDLVAGAVVGSVRPHHGARRFAQMRHHCVATMA